MNIQEAIKILSTLYPKKCKMVNGRYVGGFDDHDCMKGQAIDETIKVLEKQIPERPELWGDGYADGELVCICTVVRIAEKAMKLMRHMITAQIVSRDWSG